MSKLLIEPDLVSSTKFPTIKPHLSSFLHPKEIQRHQWRIWCSTLSHSPLHQSISGALLHISITTNNSWPPPLPEKVITFLLIIYKEKKCTKLSLSHKESAKKSSINYMQLYTSPCLPLPLKCQSQANSGKFSAFSTIWKQASWPMSCMETVPEDASF